ncbi:MAG: PQQ-binding-like beta-propeller repeat protein, partial [Lentisphaerae bacterium]|nr:PQQ-binding-like beta-propeller repeat protein [Lentisphaerota bacterium]
MTVGKRYMRASGLAGILRSLRRAGGLFAGIFLTCFCAGAVQAQDWPMWAYDAARSADSPAVAQLPTELHLQWLRELPRPRRAWPKQWDDRDKLEFDRSYAPVVADGRMFVCSMVADSLTAYSIQDGAELWRFYSAGPMRLAPAVREGRVYAVSDDGHLYCLDAATGKQLWKFNAAPNSRLVLGNNRVISMWPARGGPVVFDGKVYLAAGVWPYMGTFIYALDAVSGVELWANTGESANWQRQPHGGAFAFAGISPQGYLAATQDRLVVSGGRSLPALLDRHTGKLLYLDIFGKGVGGYQVMADDEYF